MINLKKQVNIPLDEKTAKELKVFSDKLYLGEGCVLGRWIIDVGLMLLKTAYKLVDSDDERLQLSLYNPRRFVISVNSEAENILDVFRNCLTELQFSKNRITYLKNKELKGGEKNEE